MPGPLSMPDADAVIRIFYLTVRHHSINIHSIVKKSSDADDADWEFGDAWKQGSPDDRLPEEEVSYVEILRGDTGMGYDDSTLIELIGYLSSQGIRATYDAVPLAAEFGGAIKTYVLKVEAEKAEEAIRLLNDKFKTER